MSAYKHSIAPRNGAGQRHEESYCDASFFPQIAGSYRGSYFQWLGSQNLDMVVMPLPPCLQDLQPCLVCFWLPLPPCLPSFVFLHDLHSGLVLAAACRCRLASPACLPFFFAIFCPFLKLARDNSIWGLCRCNFCSQTQTKPDPSRPSRLGSSNLVHNLGWVTNYGPICKNCNRHLFVVLWIAGNVCKNGNKHQNAICTRLANTTLHLGCMANIIKYPFPSRTAK